MKILKDEGYLRVYIHIKDIRDGRIVDYLRKRMDEVCLESILEYNDKEILLVDRIKRESGKKYTQLCGYLKNGKFKNKRFLGMPISVIEPIEDEEILALEKLLFYANYPGIPQSEKFIKEFSDYDKVKYEFSKEKYEPYKFGLGQIDLLSLLTFFKNPPSLNLILEEKGKNL